MRLLAIVLNPLGTGSEQINQRSIPLVEPVPSDPSPGPLRLVKAPAAGHPLPSGEGRPQKDIGLRGE
jgi:hypothetical protein